MKSAMTVRFSPRGGNTPWKPGVGANQPLRPVWRLLCGLVLAGLMLALGCYDPDPIESITVSPDGRYLAVTNQKGDLGLKRTDLDGPLTVYSNYNDGRVAWSPDSSRLAFVEHFPQKAPALWVIEPDRGRQAQPLLDDHAWKGDPVWLSNHELAFRSDRQAEDINVWAMDLDTKTSRTLLDRSADVSRLWGSPLGDNLIFQSAETGSSELWWWWPKADKPVQLTRDQSNRASLEQAVTFAADGRHLAYVSQRPDLRELVWFDLTRQLVTDRTVLERPADGLAVLDGGDVAVSQGDYLLLWRPDAPWYRRSQRRVSWDGTPLAKPGAIRGGGLAMSVNHNLLLLTKQPSRPDSGELLARNNDDLLGFSWSLYQRGKISHARTLLEDLWVSTGDGTEEGMTVAAGWALFERLQGHWRQADKWLERVTGSTQSDAILRESAWLERLALAMCESGEAGAAGVILKAMPEELAEDPLPRFVREVTGDADKDLYRLWQHTGAALRAGDDRKAGLLALDVMRRDTGTTVSLDGLTLMLTGDLDPFRTVDGLDEERQQQLMAVPAFQLAMLEAGRIQVGLAEPKDALVINFRQQLLTEWAREGDLNSARLLVGEDLADPARVLIDYPGLIENYLTMEEIDRWLERAVSDVILNKDHEAGLEALFADSPHDLMMNCLAHAKAALVAGETDTAAEWLERSRAIEVEPWGASPDEGEGEAENLSRGYLNVLAGIYRAKVFERRRNYAAALEMYQRVLVMMDDVQANWDVAASDVAWTIGLLEKGQADEDLLGGYMIALRGLGDPLVNPAHEQRSVASVMSSMETLRRVLRPGDQWLLPYLIFTEGLCFSKIDRPDQALYFLSSARHMQPDASQMQRILYEEAAIRSTLGQDALAARLYAQLAALPTPMPVRADALMGQIQGEWNCGLIESPGPRVMELLADHDLSLPWRKWLFDQLGVELVED